MWSVYAGDSPYVLLTRICPRADHLRLPVRHPAVRPRAPDLTCSRARQRRLSATAARRYFALIIRAISVLEGIALVGDPSFAIVDGARPRESHI